MSYLNRFAENLLIAAFIVIVIGLILVAVGVIGLAFNGVISPWWAVIEVVGAIVAGCAIKAVEPRRGHRS